MNRALGYLGNFIFYGGLVSAASFMAFVQLYSEEQVEQMDSRAQETRGEGGLAAARAAVTERLAAARQWYGSKVREFTGARARLASSASAVFTSTAVPPGPSLCAVVCAHNPVATIFGHPQAHDAPRARACTQTAVAVRSPVVLRKCISEKRADADPGSDELLPDLLPFQRQVRMRTLVLDLDGVLVESVWQRRHGWKTVKRPGAEAFLENMAHFYELVVFSDRPHSYADPILNRVDPGIATNQGAMIMYRLYKNSTHWEVCQCCVAGSERCVRTSAA